MTEEKTKLRSEIILNLNTLEPVEKIESLILNKIKESQKETLEKVRKDFKNVALINVDKYIDNELELLDKQ